MKSIDWLNVSQERQEIVTLLSSPCQPSTRRKYYAQNIIDEKRQTVLQVDPSRVVMMYMLMTQMIQIPARKQQELLDMIDTAMQAKYKQVIHLLGSDDIQVVQEKQQSLQQTRQRVLLKRKMLTRLVNHYIKVKVISCLLDPFTNDYHKAYHQHVEDCLAHYQEL